MKKVLAYSMTLMFLGILSMTVLANMDDDPKKQKTETATCAKQTEATAQEASDTPCCNKSEGTANADCPKAAECKQHSETAAKTGSPKAAECAQHSNATADKR
jgi:hypothetical protein